MKRWIHASTASEVFDVNSTGTSYYDNFLDPEDLKYMQNNKNLTGRIEMMTPQEYFSECATHTFGGRVDVAELKRSREYSHFKEGNRFIDKYAEDMARGDKFPLCFINYANPGQEGLHRMYAAGETFGWDTKFPVLVIEPYDEELWEEMQIREAIEDYRRYDLKDVVKAAVDEVSDWYKPVPDNFEERFRRAIKRLASKMEEPHQIDVRFKIDDGLVLIYLSEYDGHEVDSQSFDDKVYLEDMFDTEQKDIEELVDDVDIDDEDLDIDTYFFKEGT